MKYLNDVNYKDCVGKVCKSLNSGDFKIVEYNHARDVQVQFLKTGYEATVELVQAKRWSLQRNLMIEWHTLLDYQKRIRRANG